MSTIEHRLRRLEEQSGDPAAVTVIVLDLADGGSDMVLTGGTWKPVPDGRAVLAEHPGQPIKVYLGHNLHDLVEAMTLESRLRALERSRRPEDAAPPITCVIVRFARKPGDPPAGRYPEPTVPGTGGGRGISWLREYYDAVPLTLARCYDEP